MSTTSIDSSAVLQAIRSIIVQEVGRIETEFRTFREEICKSVTPLEQRVDTKLSSIVQRIDAIEVAQKESAHKAEEIRVQVIEVGKRTNNWRMIIAK